MPPANKPPVRGHLTSTPGVAGPNPSSLVWIIAVASLLPPLSPCPTQRPLRVSPSCAGLCWKASQGSLAHFEHDTNSLPRRQAQRTALPPLALACSSPLDGGTLASLLSSDYSSLVPISGSWHLLFL